MKKIIVPFVLITFHAVLYSQNTGSVTGRVTDKQTNEALSGATVAIKGTAAYVITNSDGNYIFQKLRTIDIVLVISYVGYETIELQVKLTDGNTTTANTTLVFDSRMGNEVVVSASKRAEKITNAPASIHVIGKKELEQFSGSNVSELYSKVQGIEFVRTGVDYIAINARGFNKAANNKIFQLVDGRNTMSTISTGLPLYNNASVIKEDIERI